MVLSAAAETTPAEQEEMVRHEAERGKYRLLDIDGLWKLYRDPGQELLLVDTRQDWEYRTGHIKGAIHFSMESSWFARLIQRHPLAETLGEDKERILVFY